MSELKPCPFCGNQPAIVDAASLGKRFSVTCYRCMVASDWYGRKEDAILEWNIRPAESALAAEVERLQSAWQVEHTERVRLEEQVKLYKATLHSLSEWEKK